MYIAIKSSLVESAVNILVYCLQCVATGSGDLDELKGCLEDNKPLYFLYRTTDTIDGHVTVKFVYIIW